MPTVTSNTFQATVQSVETAYPVRSIYSAAISYWGALPTGWTGGDEIAASNTRYWQWNNRTECLADYPTGGTRFTSVAALNTALGSASPGDKFYLADGAYSGTITCNASGNSSNPITIYAETPGGVTFTGNGNTVRPNGDFIDIWGFTWGPVTAATTTPIYVAGDDCRIILCTVDSFEPSSAATVRNWVSLFGDRNRLCFSTLKNKVALGNMANTRLNLNDGATQYSRNNRFDHNHFLNHNGYATPSNGYECIRLSTGVQKSRELHSNHLFDSNYILNWNRIGSARGNTLEGEMVSVKTGGVHAIHNVFVDNCGQFNFRNSDRHLFYGNWMIGSSYSNTEGVFDSGDNNVIMFNYFEDMVGSVTSPVLGFRSANVDPPVDGNTYNRSDNCEASFNTFYNCDSPIGFSIFSSVTAVQPINSKLYNNAVDNDGTSNSIARTLWDTTPTFGGNVMEPTVGVTDSGITAEAPDYTVDGGFYRPTASGNLDGTGVSGWNTTVGLVDILGNSIPASPNIGCFQPGYSFATSPVQAIINAGGSS